MPDALLVRAPRGADITSDVHQAGGEVAKTSEYTDYMMVRTSSSGTAAQLAAKLQAQGWDVAPLGRTRGAGGAGSSQAQNARRWHLGAIGLPRSREVTGRIAVIDSGVAYRPGPSTPLAVPPSLWMVRSSGAQDFVDGDLLPLDEHRHGTHIATTILGKATGTVGVAPGATLVPLRVLDENNEGTELDLIDAIVAATLEGVDVANMSLSLHPDYTPSRALLDAIEDAYLAGVVMVAAAGNDGLDHISWPAASPRVVAVAASTPSAQRGLTLTDYSNKGFGVDIVAPGGTWGDANQDGQQDAIVSETIALQDASQILPDQGLIGTSQASAVVAGAVMQLLDLGAHPHDVPALLQTGARRHAWNADLNAWDGIGHLDIAASVRAIGSAGAESYGAAVLPFLERNAQGQRRLSALVSVVDAAGYRIDGHMAALVTLDSTSTEHVACVPTNGTCIVHASNWTDEHDIAWTARVDGVLDVDTGITHRPEHVLFPTAALETFAQDLENAGVPDETNLAFQWSQLDDDVLGAIDDAYTIVSSGSGFATSPIGLVMSSSTFLRRATTTPRIVDLQGSGFATSPIGAVTMQDAELQLDLLTGWAATLASGPLVVLPREDISSVTPTVDVTALHVPPSAGDVPCLSLTTQEAWTPLHAPRLRARVAAGVWRQPASVPENIIVTAPAN